MDDLVVSERVTIPAKDLSWSAARAGGPGGQNVNKVASKVDLRFDLRGTTAISSEVKGRLRRLAHSRLDAEGRVQIVSQVHRDQPRNLDDAREKLVELVRAALVRPKVRKKTKPSHGSSLRRLDTKKQTGQKKEGRKKVDY